MIKQLCPLKTILYPGGHKEMSSISLPEIIDPVFAKTSQNARFLLSENERFGLVFRENWVYKFGHLSDLYRLRI
jgi:hypothetical protein